MIKLWEFLWHGCWHDWQQVTVQKLVRDNDVDVPIGHNIIYKCSKCNRFKSVSL